MFLKTLKISSGSQVIREIKFRNGINLIVDESKEQITGNNVGKTTVLKLIDFCLGSDAKQIYVDPETKRNVYELVKEYLTEKEILITLVLSDNLLSSTTKEIIIERNFLGGNKIVRRINGQNYTTEEFDTKLAETIFPDLHVEKPTFRQIISHNIRYKDESINNTLKTLDKYTTDAEYETLYLYLLGCEFDDGNTRQKILAKINQEINFKNRLEEKETKTAYETALALVNSQIQQLNEQKDNLNLNKNFEADLDSLNDVKYKINKLSSEISRLELRRNLINEAIDDLSQSKADIDFQQLKTIYSQAKKQISGIQKTFEDLVNYHNRMADEKVKFITKDLPFIEDQIKTKDSDLKILLQEENKLSNNISKTDSYEELETLISSLNEEFRKKGEYENIIQQLDEVEGNISEFKNQLSSIDDNLFSNDFEKKVQAQINKFNKYFSSISNKLYGEQYLLKYDITTNRKGQKLYKFTAFNANMSSGKKQGEISCFDIAYILFADEENIPCMHFILNDKKELMHDNQLVKIAELVNQNGIQFVASILKDKLPPELNKEEYFVVKLSQDDKLFRIEKNDFKLH